MDPEEYPGDKLLREGVVHPSLREREPRYRTFSRAYIFSRGFTPYNRFDYLITSNAAYGHFFKNEKFYPEHLRLYRGLWTDNERVKDFFYWDIEYKNPELNILRVGHPWKKKQRLTLPLSVPWDNPEREFECLDGSPYGKSALNFFLEEKRTVERVIISRQKIASLAVFVSGAEREGDVEIAHAGVATRLKIGPGAGAHIILNPRLSFPFYHHVYRISVKGTGLSSPVLVHVCADDFAIGSELFRQGRWREARYYLHRGLESDSPPAWDFEIYAELAACCRELGLAEEALRFAARAEEGPFLKGYLALGNAAEDEDTWRRRFERFSGVDIELFETLQANRLGASEMERQVPHAGDGPETSQSTEIRFVSAEKRLSPQKYRVRLRFANPSMVRGRVGRLEIVSSGAGVERRQALPVELDCPPGADAASVVLSTEVGDPGAALRFVLTLDNGQGAVFQGLEIYPDVRDFMSRRPIPVPGAGR